MYRAVEQETQWHVIPPVCVIARLLIVCLFQGYDIDINLFWAFQQHGQSPTQRRCSDGPMAAACSRGEVFILQ
jgi:hypothetical protein